MLSHNLVKHNPHLSSDAHKEHDKIDKYSALHRAGLSGSDIVSPLDVFSFRVCVMRQQQADAGQEEERHSEVNGNER